MGADRTLLEQGHPTLQSLHERISINPSHWRHDHRLRRAMGTSKQQNVAARPQKRLHCIEHPHFDPHGSHAYQIEGLVQLRPGQKLFNSDSFNVGRPQTEMTGGVPQKRGFSDLRLNHGELEGRKRQLQRNCWRTSSRANVHEPGGRGRDISSCEQRFQEQPVNSLVWIGEGSQIDLLVPPEQKSIKRGDLLNELIVEEESHAGRTTSQPGREIARCHAGRVSEVPPLALPL